jgi:hypothetical protein
VRSTATGKAVRLQVREAARVAFVLFDEEVACQFVLLLVL